MSFKETIQVGIGWLMMWYIVSIIGFIMFQDTEKLYNSLIDGILAVVITIILDILVFNRFTKECRN